MKLSRSSLKVSNHYQGFSLLETLVASVIFAVVLATASIAFKLFVNSAVKPAISEDVLGEAALNIQVRNALKGTKHIFIPVKNQSIIKPKLFFLASDNFMTGITTNAIGFPNQPTQYKVFLSPNEDEWDLWYCEYDMSKAYPELLTTNTCDFSVIVARGVTEINIRYFGSRTLNELFGLTGTSAQQGKKWYDDWNGDRSRVLPQYIKINIIYGKNAKSSLFEQMWFRIADADPVQLSENAGVTNE